MGFFIPDGMMGRYARGLAAGLGIYAAAACGGGRGPTGPDPIGQTSFAITEPANNQNAQMPVNVRYSFNDPQRRQLHADFILDNGETYHDRTLDGSHTIEGLAPGNHRLSGYLADQNEQRVDNTNSDVQFNAVGSSRVNGNVTNRINGQPMNGVAIKYEKILANGLGEPITANVENGRYEIDGISSGDYRVTIEDPTGSRHVTHQNLSVPVSNGAERNFSLLTYGAQNPSISGAVFDRTFEQFYRMFANLNGNGVNKWSSMPSEIYVTEGGLAPDRFEDTYNLIKEVVKESISKMYCGKVSDIPVNRGPPIGNEKTGSIIIKFANNAGTRYWGVTNNLPVITGAQIDLDINTHSDTRTWDRNRRKYQIAHELLHTTGAQHSFNTYRYSLMGGWSDVTFPSSEDNLATCMMYHNDVNPGNKTPDTNPSYR